MRRNHNREIELFDFPFEDNIDLLSAFVTEWSKGDGPIRSALQANLPEATGFHAETVKKGLAVAWDGFNGTDLWECVERELLKPLRTSSPRLPEHCYYSCWLSSDAGMARNSSPLGATLESLREAFTP